MPTLATSTSGQELIPRSRLRKSLIFQNEDATIDMFIRQERTVVPDVSATIHDHKRAAGGVFSLTAEEDGIEAVQDRWTVIAASGTPLISFFETEDTVR